MLLQSNGGRKRWLFEGSFLEQIEVSSLNSVLWSWLMDEIRMGDEDEGQAEEMNEEKKGKRRNGDVQRGCDLEALKLGRNSWQAGGREGREERRGLKL